ncbi:MAG: energy transducer TonB [Betaproteobacteria bacterium]|nr:energy transducer TonB [Betaproteobacteria bacterium]
MAAVPEAGHHVRHETNNTLLRAVFGSIALHALTLLLIPGLLDTARPRRPDPGPIVARLVQTRPAVAPPAAVQEPPKQRVEEAPRPAHSRLLVPNDRPTTVAPPLALAPLVPLVPMAPPPVQPAETFRAAEPVQSAPADVRLESTARSANLKAVQPAPQSVDSADPVTLGQYRIAIISAARRYKQYPRIAMDNNWEGRVEVRMVIDVDGAIASASIKTRSGFEVLDQQALEMIRKAKPLAPIPAALRGKGFSVDIPVLFSLKEETG